MEALSFCISEGSPCTGTFASSGTKSPNNHLTPSSRHKDKPFLDVQLAVCLSVTQRAGKETQGGNGECGVCRYPPSDVWSPALVSVR